MALCLKIFWRVFYSSGWSKVLHSQYLRNTTMVDWFTWNYSNLWKGFIKVYPWFGLGLAWKLGNGAKVMVEIDPMLGANVFFFKYPIL